MRALIHLRTCFGAAARASKPALALTVTTLLALAAPAAADDFPMFPGVRSDGSPGHAFVGVMLGHIKSHSYDDNLHRGDTENAGWAYGINIRGQIINLVDGYGGRFGFAMDVDMFLVTGGVIDGPQQPRGSYVFLGMTPALALGVLKTKRTSINLELGTAINTDFYGLSGGVILAYRSFYLAYRVRSGVGWHGTQVLDERVRVGFADFGGHVVAKSFFGIEVIDGYSEDSMGRADLRSMFRGGYNMVSVILAGGK